MFKRPLVNAAILAMTLLGGQSVVADLIDGEELRDPTRPAGMTLQTLEVLPPSTPDFAVDFIRAGEVDALAVVNGKSVRVGDEVDGALVTGIARDQVTIMLGNRTLELRPNQPLRPEVRIDTPAEEPTP